MLDHPSLSRHHAAVCYNRLSRAWVVLDLDSAHGTRADGKQAPKVSSGSALASLLQAADATLDYQSPESTTGDKGAGISLVKHREGACTGIMQSLMTKRWCAGRAGVAHRWQHAALCSIVPGVCPAPRRWR